MHAGARARGALDVGGGEWVLECVCARPCLLMQQVIVMWQSEICYNIMSIFANNTGACVCLYNIEVYSAMHVRHFARARAPRMGGDRTHAAHARASPPNARFKYYGQHSDLIIIINAHGWLAGWSLSVSFSHEHINYSHIT